LTAPQFAKRYPLPPRDAQREGLIASVLGEVWCPERTRWSLKDPETTFVIMAASSARLGISVINSSRSYRPMPSAGS
jgi:hypothetical protein